VTGKARDSITFNVKSQIIKLYGDAKLTYKTQILTADYVEMSMKDATLLAEPTIDSNGKVKNFPVFNDKGEEYYGKVIRYILKLKKEQLN
jgi:lipopolysaccharide export system protein LptA